MGKQILTKIFTIRQGFYPDMLTREDTSAPPLRALSVRDEDEWGVYSNVGMLSNSYLLNPGHFGSKSNVCGPFYSKRYYAEEFSPAILALMLVEISQREQNNSYRFLFVGKLSHNGRGLSAAPFNQLSNNLEAAKT